MTPKTLRAPLFWLGVIIVGLAAVTSVRIAINANTELTSEQLGREMTWLLWGLLAAFFLAYFIGRVLPRTPGAYMLYTGVCYAIIAAWQTKQFTETAASQHETRVAVAAMLSGQPLPPGTDYGEFEPFVRYIEEQNEMANADFNRLNAAADSAYAAFDFARLPGMDNCDGAIRNWTNYAEVAEEVHANLTARSLASDTEIAELDVPTDFKRGLLSGIEPSRSLTLSANGELFDAMADLAAFQIDACEWLLSNRDIDSQVEPMATERAEFPLWQRRGESIYLRIEVALQKLAAIEREASSRAAGT